MASKLLILDSISMIIDGNKANREGIKGQKQVIFILAQHLKEMGLCLLSVLKLSAGGTGCHCIS